MTYDVWPPLDFYNPKCRCGGTYRRITYTVKHGERRGESRTFYGCSDYPRCRATMSERTGDAERRLNMPWNHPWFSGFAICYVGDGKVYDAITGRILRNASLSHTNPKEPT